LLVAQDRAQILVQRQGVDLVADLTEERRNLLQTAVQLFGRFPLLAKHVDGAGHGYLS
jgi:hypothetical protein